jgi:hypothetical protein
VLRVPAGLAAVGVAGGTASRNVGAAPWWTSSTMTRSFAASRSIHSIHFSSGYTWLLIIFIP